jgi:hypothetical protein
VRRIFSNPLIGMIYYLLFKKNYIDFVPSTLSTNSRLYLSIPPKSTITNDDIEDILRRGEAKTAELDQKYKNMGLEDALNFTTEGSAYQWEGSDFRKQQQSAGFMWIQPAKREKKGGEGLGLTQKYYYLLNSLFTGISGQLRD